MTTQAGGEGEVFFRRATRFGGAAWFLVGVPLLALGRGITGAVSIATGLFYLAVSYAVSTRRALFRPGVHATTCASILAMVAVALIDDGVDDVRWPFLMLVPLFLGQVFEDRWSRFGWALASTAGILFVHAWSAFSGSAPAAYKLHHLLQGAFAVLLTWISHTFSTFFHQRVASRVQALESSEKALRAKSDDLVETGRGLEQARDAALRASRSKSEFLARMSHELRTPLNGILGLSVVLDESELSREQREIVRTIRESGETLRKILNEVLDIVRVEAGKIEVLHETFDPWEVIEDVADVFAAQAAAKGLVLTTVLERTTGLVVGDPMRVRQIMTNLVGNAVKFTDVGRITVRGTALLDGENGAMLDVEVDDTGPGIPHDRQEVLFEAFEQVDVRIEQRRAGSGLGLAISRKFAEAMGGDIVVASVVGRGSTFRFGCHVDLATTLVPEAPTRSRMLFISKEDIERDAAIAIAHSSRLALITAAGIDQACAILAQDGPIDVVIVDAAVLADQNDSARLRQAAGTVSRTVFLLAAPPRKLDALSQQVTAHGFVSSTLLPLRRSRLLAIAAEMEASRTPSVQPPALSSRPDPERAPPIALVVDDDPTNRKVAGLLLRRFGWLSVEVSSGQEALDRVRHEEFDAVLLDLHMPEMDGITTSTAIRSLGLAKPPVLIALTASVFEEDRRRCAEAGMTDFVPKPIEPGALQGALERAERLSRRRSSRLPQVDVALRSSVVPEGIDRPALERVLILARDADERATLVQDYLTQSRNYRDDMRKALESDDRVLLHRAAHTLASSSALFGATRLAAMTRLLENDAKQGDPKTLSVQIDHIAQAFALVEKELEAILKAP